MNLLQKILISTGIIGGMISFFGIAVVFSLISAPVGALLYVLILAPNLLWLLLGKYVNRGYVETTTHMIGIPKSSSLDKRTER